MSSSYTFATASDSSAIMANQPPTATSQQHYRDLSHMIESESFPAVPPNAFDQACGGASATSNRKRRAGSARSKEPTFPQKLHYVLKEMANDKMEHIMRWQPHGRAFIVRDSEEFTNKILPFWFRQSKFPSFQRQLNLYGFRRITRGPDAGSYYHECFLRGKPFLSKRIIRTKIKGPGNRRPSSTDYEPPLHLFPAMPEDGKAHNQNKGNVMSNINHGGLAAGSVVSSPITSTRATINPLSSPPTSSSEAAQQPPPRVSSSESLSAVAVVRRHSTESPDYDAVTTTTDSASVASNGAAASMAALRRSPVSSVPSTKVLSHTSASPRTATFQPRMHLQQLNLTAPPAAAGYSQLLLAAMSQNHQHQQSLTTLLSPKILSLATQQLQQQQQQQFLGFPVMSNSNALPPPVFQQQGPSAQTLLSEISPGLQQHNQRLLTSTNSAASADIMNQVLDLHQQQRSFLQRAPLPSTQPRAQANVTASIKEACLGSQSFLTNNSKVTSPMIPTLRSSPSSLI